MYTFGERLVANDRVRELRSEAYRAAGARRIAPSRLRELALRISR